MTETLQRFSTGNLTLLLGGVIAFWLIWPIICGLLGASRGLGWQGVSHGLLWGPLGLLFVLLGKQRYACPTCGQKTLPQPIESPPFATVAPPPEPGPHSTDVNNSRVSLPPVIAESHVQSSDLKQEFGEAATDSAEMDRLHAWLNES